MKKILLKVKNSFLTNLPWKIAAFFMAFVLWFLIMNVEDPMRTEAISVSLELRNEDALAEGSAQGIHLENIDLLRGQSIRFQIRGTSRSIDAIRNSLGAYIDLSTSDIAAAAQRGEPLRVNVQMEGYGSAVEVLGFSPSSVNLIMDTIITIEMAVEVETKGEISNDFIILSESIYITPDVVSVTGPSSIVNRIERLAVTVDVNEAVSAIEMENLDIIALDVTGIPVVSGHLQFKNTADVELPVFRRGRVQVLQPAYNHAQSPAGFGIHSVSWNPQWLDVAGEEDAIASLAPVMLMPIPEGLIMNHTTDFSEQYDIRFFLPQGVFLIDPSRHIITVDVFVEPFVQQDFVIPIEYISIVGMPYYAEVVDAEVVIRLSALQSIMAGVGSITPTAFVNSINLEAGYNEIPLVIALPARVSLIGDEAPTISIYVEAIEEGYEESENEEGEESEENEESGD